MSIITRSVAALSAVALAIAPAALAKPGGGPGGPDGHGNPPAAQHGKGHQKPKKPKKVVAKGTVVSYDAAAGTLVVHVTRANHHGKAMVGSDVSFDVSKARFTAADTNGDGTVDANDLVAGDKVVVQTNNAADDSGRYPARHVVDQTHPAKSDDDSSEPAQTDS